MIDQFGIWVGTIQVNLWKKGSHLSVLSRPFFREREKVDGLMASYFLNVARVVGVAGW